jgi:uncharacterized protein YegL
MDSSFVRRLPVYLLLDCSGSMAGEPIAALDMGLRALLTDLRNDPQALETVWLGVITFARNAEPAVPLTPLTDFVPPALVAEGTTALGEALDLLTEQIRAEVHLSGPDRKGDWRPVVFLLTDGEPTDDWERSAEEFRLRNQATVVVCGAGPEVNDDTLRRLGDKVVRLKDTQPGTLGAFMKWVSASVTNTSRSLGARSGTFDPTPPITGTEGIELIL